MPAVARRPRRHSLVWLQGLGCGAVVALVPAMALLLGALLLPGVLAVVYDRQAGRPVARTGTAVWHRDDDRAGAGAVDRRQ